VTPLDEATAAAGAHGSGEPPARRRITPVKVLLTLVCLLLAAMWVYAFGFASKKAAYRVDDEAWRTRAQDICEAHEQQRLALVDTSEGYIAEPTHAQMLQRADLVDQATDILEDQLEQMVGVMPSSERDRSLVDEYAGYYRTVISDRRAYTAHLRRFELVPYRETAVSGGPVSNVLSDFTVVNEMPACAPPNELGGAA
jgi:hypothetical protein